jgi:hypothetical protein
LQPHYAAAPGKHTHSPAGICCDLQEVAKALVAERNCKFLCHVDGIKFNNSIAIKRRVCICVFECGEREEIWKKQSSAAAQIEKQQPRTSLSGGRFVAEGKLAVKEGVFNILWRTLIFEAP